MKRPDAATAGYDMKAMQMYAGMMGAYANQAKRHRPNAPPSKCLHVRALPPYCTEQELSLLFGAFGRVDKMLIMRTKLQAFVQMESEMVATAVVNHFALAPAMIRGKAIYVQYSTHKELTDSSSSSAHKPNASNQPTNSILMVSIENVQCPVTLDNLVTVFKPYGTVLKIVTFLSESNYKALVEMGSVESAVAARMNLEGKDMFQGCCTLRINYSKLKSLTVTQNGAKSWDFIKQPVMEPQVAPAFGIVQHLAQAANSLYTGYGMYDQKQNIGGGYDAYGQLIAGTLGMPNMVGMGAVPPHMAAGLRRGGATASGPMGALGLPGIGGLGRMPGMGMGVGGGGARGALGGEVGCVVLVSNLPADGRVKPDHLFNLFGCYGNVLRVKVLFKKQSTALIQFQTPTGAQLARRFLNRTELHGTQLDVRASKHQSVALPKEEDSDAAAFNKDFASSKLHRFKQGLTNNLKNIYGPTRVLHVSNVSLDTKESQLIELFRPYGVVGFEWLKKMTEKRMAFVALASETKAIEAVMYLHCTNIDGRDIRISFSKKEAESIALLTSEPNQPQQAPTSANNTQEQTETPQTTPQISIKQQQQQQQQQQGQEIKDSEDQQL